MPKSHSFNKHSWPSVSVGFATVDSTNGRLKILEEKCYVVADDYYIFRPLVVVCVLNMYRLFLLVIIPQTIQYNNYLHSIYIALGILSNLVILSKSRFKVNRRMCVGYMQILQRFIQGA